MANWQTIARRIRVPLGFVFAGVYLWLARPGFPSLAVGACFVLTGLAIRALASGHVRKNEQLTTTGPYAYTRNPLYLGSLVLAAGFVIGSRSWILAVIAAALFFAIYLPVIRAEEHFLRSRFPEFDEYARNVPRLLPRIHPYRGSETSFSVNLYWKHREYNATAGAALMFAALVAKTFWFTR
jgi:protein-S-isoprenylcysteine O-methyltransferase Ste14